MPSELDCSWEELAELMAFDEIMTPLDNESICPDCKQKMRFVERTCGLCENTFDFSDKKAAEGVMRSRKTQPRSKMAALLHRRTVEILHREKVIA